MDIVAKTILGTHKAVNKCVSTFGNISSIASDGKKLNVRNVFDGEIRDIRIITPYGISSCGVDGIYSQMAVNDNNNNVQIGVYDDNKPSCEPGQIIIYSSGNANIKLDTDGSITLSSSGGATINLGSDGSITLSSSGGATINLSSGGSLSMDGNSIDLG